MNSRETSIKDGLKIAGGEKVIHDALNTIDLSKFKSIEIRAANAEPSACPVINNEKFGCRVINV